MRSLMLIAAAGFLLVAGCEKKKAKTAPTTAATAKGGNGAPAPATTGGGNTNYQAGAGALQNTRQAARRTQVANDMRTLGQAIEQSQAPHARDIVILAVFFALFTGGAAWLYRKDTLKA